MTASLVFLCGVPGSGKSTWANKQTEYEVISSDSIRLEIFGDETDQKHNSEVFQEVENRAVELINQNKKVIIDATNLRARLRRQMAANIFKRTPTKILFTSIVMFDRSLEWCKRMNARRERKVPDEVIERMYKDFEASKINVNYEPQWSSITFIR